MPDDKIAKLSISPHWLILEEADSFDAALIPTLAQLTGFPLIDETDITAQNTDSGKNVTKNRTNLLNGTSNRSSYGQLNSKIEPFDGPLPLGMVVYEYGGQKMFGFGVGGVQLFLQQRYL